MLLYGNISYFNKSRSEILILLNYSISNHKYTNENKHWDTSYSKHEYSRSAIENKNEKSSQIIFLKFINKVENPVATISSEVCQTW